MSTVGEGEEELDEEEEELDEEEEAGVARGKGERRWYSGVSRELFVFDRPRSFASLLFDSDGVLFNEAISLGRGGSTKCPRVCVWYALHLMYSSRSFWVILFTFQKRKGRSIILAL